MLLDKNNKGFTIVELLVVLVILVVLGTIGFISYSGYLVGVRDTSRKVDLDDIGQELSNYYIRSGKYPLPDDYKNVTYSGVNVWHQGVFGDTVIEKLEGSKSQVLDPLTDNYYTYSIVDTKKEYQLATVLESDEETAYENILINKSYAASVRSAKAYITGNYNGQIKHLSTGGTDFVLALPSIISSDLSDTRLETIINNKLLAYNNFSNLPASYSGGLYELNGGFDYEPNGGSFIIFSGSFEDLSDSYERIDFIYNLQQSYSGTILEGIGSINDLITTEIDFEDPSIDLSNLSCDIIEYNLNYPLNCNYKDFFTFFIIDDSGVIEIEEGGEEGGEGGGEGGGEIITVNIDYDELPSNRINVIFKDSNDNLWFGTEKGIGVKKSDGTYEKFILKDYLPIKKMEIETINEDSNGNIWFGGWHGMSKFDGNFSGGTWDIFKDDSYKKAYTIYTEESGGGLYIGTKNGASYIDGGGSISEVSDSNGLDDEKVYKITKSGDGSTWFGTKKGLFRLKSGGTEWEVYKNKDSHPYDFNMESDDIRSVFVDSGDNLWIGTRKGVIMYDYSGGASGDWIVYNTSNTGGPSEDDQQLVSDKIDSIFEDADGNIWVGTRDGVSMFDPGTELWKTYPKSGHYDDESTVYLIFEDGSFKILGIEDDD